MRTRKRKQVYDEAEVTSSKPNKASKSKSDGTKGSSQVTETKAAGKGVEALSVPLGDSKSVQCERRGLRNSTTPSLIFTHGAGGGISNPATVGFAEGYAASAEVVCFQGSMNLKSRVTSFTAVVQHEASRVKQKGGVKYALGGRSMGARAAVMTASESTSEDITLNQLIIVSYPLKGANGAVRDEILLDLNANKKVLFISGSNDHMCSIEDLNKVRAKMKAESWLIVVEGAGHGMSMKGKGKEQAAAATRRKSGELAAAWAAGQDSEQREKSIAWDGDEQTVVVETI